MALAVQLPGHVRFVRVRGARDVAAFLGVVAVPRLSATPFAILGVCLGLALAMVAVGAGSAKLWLVGAAAGAIVYFAQVINIPEVRRKANSVPIILLLCGVAGLAPADQAESVARGCLLTIKLVVAQIYLSSALMKLRRVGFRWADGVALRSVSAHYALATSARSAAWLAGKPRACAVAASVVLWFEGTFWLMIPFPALAWIYLPVGFAFHLGTAVMMRIHYWIYLLPAYLVFVLG